MKKICIICLVLIILLVGCSQTNKISTLNASQELNFLREFEIEKSQYDSIIAHTKDYIFLGKCVGSDLKISSYNISNSKFSNIGEIKNYILSNGDVAEINNKLYFFITTLSRNTKTNHFYCIDIEKQTLEELYSENLYQAFNYFTVFNEKLFIIKGDKKDNIAVTYIEEYDVNTNKTNIIKKLTTDYEKETGGVILNITSDKENLVVYYQNYVNSQLKRFIDVYDSDLKLLYSKEIEYNKENLLDQMVGSFEIWENYLRIENFSNTSAILDLDDKKDPIFNNLDNPLSLAQQTREPLPYILLFKRGSTEMFVLKSDGKLEKYDDLKIAKGYVIRHITQCSNNICIWLKNENNDIIKCLLYESIDMIK